MRDRLRKWRFWLDLRRWQQDGALASHRRWKTYCEILSSPPVFTERSGSDRELHLLCYRNDYLGAIWTLKTFYHFAEVRIPLVIHIQGHATSLMTRRLKHHFPDARLIQQEEADAIVVPELTRRQLTRLLTARAANHYTLKLTDFVLLSKAQNILTLDSDILFFDRPREFLAPSPGHLFQRDPESTYVLSPESVKASFNVELAPCINVGMMHFQPGNISLERCDQYLAAFPKLDGWLEQTLYAIHASERGEVEYLPNRYLISLDRGIDHSCLIARHYAGPSRSLMHQEGIPFLLKERPNIRNLRPPEKRSELLNRQD
jgi:hypothetical protein